MQLPVKPVGRYEVCVAAAFQNPAAFDHQNLPAACHRRKSMSNDNDGALVEHGFNGFLHAPFRVRVHTGRRLVQNN